MSLGGHLRELRKRLVWSASFIVAGTAVGWLLFDPVFNLLQNLVLSAARKLDIEASINFGTLGGAFDLRIQVSIFLGILMSSPFWMYHLWRFITPALKRREKLYTFGFLSAAVPLFFGGCYIAWISIPSFIQVLLSLTPTGSVNIINATDYMLFTLRILLVFGIAFLIPVVLVLLNFVGLLTAKQIVGSWRVAVVLGAVIAALATPTADPTSMFLLMIPLLVLYFLAAGIAALRDRWKLRKANSVLVETE